VTRNVHSSALAQTQLENLTAVTFVTLEFESGTLYANSSPINILYGGNNYLGVGKLGGIAAVQESAELALSNMNLTLVGVDTTLLSAALNEEYRDRDATVEVAFLDSSNAVIGQPTVVFKGRMDSMGVNVGKEQSITLTVINRLADWERTRNGRYTNEEQQKLYPGDKSLEFVVQSVEKQIFWGRNEPT